MTARPRRRWRHVQPCGTPAAYQRHLRHGEVPCEPCRLAVNQQRAGQRKTQREAP